MTLASHVLRYLKQPLAKIARSPVLVALVLMALLFVTSCGSASPTIEPASTDSQPAVVAPRPTIQQVETPQLIRELSPWLDRYAPLVQINQPKSDQVLTDTTINVVLGVQDLPIYKDDFQGMGPHVDLILDNQPYASVYDIEQPIILRDLTPGTHTLRAFAVRPWHESFKNEGAYAQVTFHIFAKTDENTPTFAQPLLTYGSPVGTYGADPILLDFYLTDAPLHQVAQENPTLADWQIRYTINGKEITLKNWEPIYIEGLQPGQNWVQLTLIDEAGSPIEGVFNNTVRLIEFNPELEDSLAKIVRGTITLEEVGSIVDPNYEPPVPEISEPEISEPPIAPETKQGNKLDKALDINTDIPANIEPEDRISEDNQDNKSEDRAIPKAIESEAIKPESAVAPESIESEVVAPEVVAPESIEPEVVEPESIESEVIDEVVEPELVEPELVEPELVEPELVEPEVIEPEVVEPKVVEPEVVEPKAVDELVEPEVTKPETVAAETPDNDDVVTSLDQTTTDTDDNVAEQDEPATSEPELTTSEIPESSDTDENPTRQETTSGTQQENNLPSAEDMDAESAEEPSTTQQVLQRLSKYLER